MKLDLLFWRRFIPGFLGIANAVILVTHRELGLLAIGAYGYLPFLSSLGGLYFVLLFGSPLLSLISGLLIIAKKLRMGGILLMVSGLGMLISWFGPVGWIAGPILIVAGYVAYKDTQSTNGGFIQSQFK